MRARAGPEQEAWAVCMGEEFESNQVFFDSCILTWRILSGEGCIDI